MFVRLHCICLAGLHSMCLAGYTRCVWQDTLYVFGRLHSMRLAGYPVCVCQVSVRRLQWRAVVILHRFLANHSTGAASLWPVTYIPSSRAICQYVEAGAQ